MSHLKLVVDNANGTVDDCGNESVTESVIKKFEEVAPNVYKKIQKPSNRIHGFRYAKTKRLYSASNCTFNSSTLQATSYNWWLFVAKINGKIVFNNYRYSNSTSKHQSNVIYLMRQLGIQIDLEVECPGGLQDLESGIRHYKIEIEQLNKLIAKGRKAKNIERMAEIKIIEGKIKTLEQLIKISKSA